MKLNFPKLIIGFSLILSSELSFAQLVTPVELGSSPNPVGSGARAMGQGNAFIAIADDATSASWNPGGLSQLEKPEYSFAYEYFSRDELIHSNKNPESNSRSVLNLSDLNYASFVVPYFYHRNMVFSLNYLKLYRYDKTEGYPVNFSVAPPINSAFNFDQEGSLTVLAPAFGIDVTPKLALGITLNIWNHSVTQASRFTKKETTDYSFTVFGETGTGKIVNIDSMEVDSGYSIVIGGLYRISKAWAFGAVVKPYYELDLERRNDRFSVQNSQPLGLFNLPADPTTTYSEVELEFPWIIGAGLAWRPNDEWTVSMDVTWTDWSDYTFVDDKEKAALGNRAVKNPITGQPIKPVPGNSRSGKKLEDTYTARIGSEYLFIFDKYLIPLRCGFGYDPVPAVDETDDFYTINFGAGVQIKEKINLDIAYEYRWGREVNAASLTGINGTQKVNRYRILTSLIYYF